jgi:hypothetical protein
MPHGKKKARKGAVSKKISHLVHEGKPQEQAVAMALNMKREGRLTSTGGYRRKRKKQLFGELANGYAPK